MVHGVIMSDTDVGTYVVINDYFYDHIHRWDAYVFTFLLSLIWTYSSSILSSKQDWIELYVWVSEAETYLTNIFPMFFISLFCVSWDKLAGSAWTVYDVYGDWHGLFIQPLVENKRASNNSGSVGSSSTPAGTAYPGQNQAHHQTHHSYRAALNNSMGIMGYMQTGGSVSSDGGVSSGGRLSSGSAHDLHSHRGHDNTGGSKTQQNYMQNHMPNSNNGQGGPRTYIWARFFILLAFLLFLSNKVSSFMQRMYRCWEDWRENSTAAKKDTTKKDTVDSAMVVAKFTSFREKLTSSAEISEILISFGQGVLAAVKFVALAVYGVWDQSVRSSQIYGLLRRLAIIVLLYYDPAPFLNIAFPSAILDHFMTGYLFPQHVYQRFPDIFGDDESLLKDVIDWTFFSMHFIKILQLSLFFFRGFSLEWVLLNELVVSNSVVSNSGIDASGEIGISDYGVGGAAMDPNTVGRSFLGWLLATVLSVVWVFQLWQNFHDTTFTMGFCNRLCKKFIGVFGS